MKWAYGLVRKMRKGERNMRLDVRGIGNSKLFFCFSQSISYSLLVAVGLHARCSGGFCVGSGDHGLGVGFVEDALNDLLLFGTENLGQTLVQLGLFLLEAWS